MAKGRCTIHRLMKVDNTVWSCIVCPYFLHVNQAVGIIGKRTSCFDCGKIFVVTKEATRADQLRCDSCYMSDAERAEKIRREQLVQDMLDSQNESEDAVERIRVMNKS